jgi:hypothetical protein
MNTITEIVDRIRDDLAAHHPKTILLFGSAARYLQKIQEEKPKDFDVFFVAAFTPVLSKSLPVKLDLHVYTEYEILRIARSLRYSPRVVSRAKMYMQDTWHATLRSDIAACLLIGPSYQDYGFLQMENEETYRDYSIHKVIFGKRWWRSLQTWAQEHRGPKGLFFDKVLGSDQFKPDVS